MNSCKPVVIIQHTFHEHAAALGRALQGQGTPVRIVHVYQGEHLPDDEASVAGVISLGGPMGANDEDLHPWILPEIDFLKKCAQNQLPVVGICLGGQLLAKALGGRVERNHTKELGWLPIEINLAGKKDPILSSGGASPTVYHWHNDTFILPAEAELLASSQGCERQAYKIGERIYGFQFHPETDHHLVQEWLMTDGAEDEVKSSLQIFGSHSIQDIETQRNQAPHWERSSLSLTAAISHLFRSRPIASVPYHLKNHLAQLSLEDRMIQVELLNSNNQLIEVKGSVVRFFTISAGDFILFKEITGLIWPIRIEDIINTEQILF